jgi:hypothetical protein
MSKQKEQADSNYYCIHLCYKGEERGVWKLLVVYTKQGYFAEKNIYVLSQKNKLLKVFLKTQKIWSCTNAAITCSNTKQSKKKKKEKKKRKENPVTFILQTFIKVESDICLQCT